MRGAQDESPTKNGNEHIYSRIVGHANEANIFFCGMKTIALIDSGSMVTTVSEAFYESLNPRPSLRKLDDLELRVHGPNGAELPYLGYIEASIDTEFLPSLDFDIPVLVVPTYEDGLRVPVVIGTNFIRLCQENCEEEVEIPDEWNTAFMSLQTGLVASVKATNKKAIEVKPFETITLTGFVRKSRNVDTAVTEATVGASTRIGVCPRLVSLTEPGNPNGFR